MSNKRNEKYYQKRFLEYLEQNRPYSYLVDSEFIDELKLFYDMEKIRMEKSKVIPDYSVDFIEVDRMGCLHIWEAKMLDKEELIRGKVIGQLYFYHFLLRSYDVNKLILLLRDKGVSEEKLDLISRNGIIIKTWNILVCGGRGWELCAGINPIMWTYNDFSIDTEGSNIPPTSVYHFYQVNKEYDLKHLFEQSIFYPEYLHSTVYERVLNEELKVSKDYWEDLIKSEGMWNQEFSEAHGRYEWFQNIGR